MDQKSSGDIWFNLSHFETEERIASPRYRWDCTRRGDIPFVILQWTLAGEGRFENGTGIHPVPRDHAFVAVVPEPSTYYYPPESREPWVFGWLSFYGDLACELFRKFQSEFGPVIVLPGRSAAAASLRRLLAAAASLDRAQVSLRAYAFLLDWWQEASQPVGATGDRLDRATRFCRGHFREQLSVKQIADEAGMSREHFSRVFVRRTGETPAAFLQNLRLTEAAGLLRDTRLPLGEIALRSGFYSARHLMRAFQRVYGKPPSRLRTSLG
ncbi:MAG: helix-turn-helix domain-containing protein [Methylacidiphilales bacterium]|nr:helix-turn-helix domain-containing protein [Candidatus Methylacidiphilales bacterium]